MELTVPILIAMGIDTKGNSEPTVRKVRASCLSQPSKYHMKAISKMTRSLDIVYYTILGQPSVDIQVQ